MHFLLPCREDGLGLAVSCGGGSSYIVDKYQHLGVWLMEHVEWNTLTSQARACGGLDMKLSKQVVVSCSYGGGWSASVHV